MSIEALDVIATEGDHALFARSLLASYEQGRKEGLLGKLQAQAWNAFLAKGLPRRNDEAFAYVPLHQLLSKGVVHARMPGVLSSLPQKESGVVLIFVDGHYQPILSSLEALPKGACVLPMTQAIRQFGAFLQPRYTKDIEQESNPFALLNMALCGEGAFVYLPPKMRLDAPLWIRHLTTEKGEYSMTQARVHIVAGAHAEAVVVQEVHGDKEVFSHVVTDVTLEEGARLSYTMLDERKGWGFSSLRGWVKRSAHFESVSLSEGHSITRDDYKMTLAGEGSNVLLHGLWVLGQKAQHHVHVLMEHAAPHCRSMQLFKGVLDDVSRSSFEGKIYVHQVAQKTEGFQLNHNLLLQDKAIAHSKPNLEIFADDVKASHGATVGQLDPELLFYLKTRGVAPEVAKGLLVAGFCAEVLEKVPVEAIRQRKLAQVHQQFSPKM